jgi:hypothetical protein
MGYMHRRAFVATALTDGFQPAAREGHAMKLNRAGVRITVTARALSATPGD